MHRLPKHNPGGSFGPRDGLGLQKALQEYKRMGDHYRRYLFASKFCTDKTVLDLGCGHGLGRLVLGSLREYVGVDIDEQALQWARKNLQPRLPFTQFVDLEGLRANLSDRLFDVVIAFEVVEHINDVIDFSKLIRNRMGTASVALLSTPNGAFSHGNPDLYVTEYHLQEYSLEEFELILKTIGDNYRIFKEHRIDRLDVLWRKRQTTPHRTTIGSRIAPKGMNPIRLARSVVRLCLNGPIFWTIRAAESQDNADFSSLNYTTIIGLVQK
ncbi:MAG TPA: methyltransferase domain-containing protein [Nitrososphaerales archaeon]|nr:methyltransferase domain-containing protein [Nitrososphaerales archaeon]